MVDGWDAGARLMSSAAAMERYREAMDCLGRATRELIELRIVTARPINEAARMSGVTRRLGSGRIDLRAKFARVLIEAGLQADHFGLAGALRYRESATTLYRGNCACRSSSPLQPQRKRQSAGPSQPQFDPGGR